MLLIYSIVLGKEVSVQETRGFQFSENLWISALANLESAIIVSNRYNITYFFVFSKAVENLGVVLSQGLANFDFRRPQMKPLKKLKIKPSWGWLIKDLDQSD